MPFNGLGCQIPEKGVMNVFHMNFKIFYSFDHINEVFCTTFSN